MNFIKRFFRWFSLGFTTINSVTPVTYPRPLITLNPILIRGGYGLDYSASTGCPDCGSQLFLRGPSGGMSMNIKCANDTCGSKFCYCPPFTPERIYNDDKYYYGICKLEDL